MPFKLFDSRDKNLSVLLSTIAALALLAGYADLVRGGITLSALLLTAAYVLFIPLAIWSSGGRLLDGTLASRRELLRGATAAVGVFVLYLATLAPTTATWDTSEYLAAAYTMGIPHPPGNPLFVLLGRFFALLPIAPTVAQRINILAALASAISAGIWFMILRRLARQLDLGEGLCSVLAALGMILGACAFTVWHQSVVNEKVYTLALLGIALISWQMMRWLEAPDGPRADARLVMIAYLLMLGYSNHNAGLLPAPMVLFAVVMQRRMRWLRVRLLVRAAVVAALGFSPFATQPIRAAHNPMINEGEPTACRAGLKWSCTFSEGTWTAFSYNLQRLQYGKPSLAIRQAPIKAQLEMYWLYFKWQWFRDPFARWPRTQHLMAVAILLAGLFGGWTHYRRHRESFWYFGSLTAALSVGLVYYLNFKLGASQSPIEGVPFEVRDRDYFFIWSFSAWSVWAGLGLAAFGKALFAPFAGALNRVRGLPAIVHATPLLVAAAVTAAGNARWASRHNDTVVQSFAHDLLNSVEPHAILITNGDNDTFPLWYAQQVEGVRPDVTVVIPELLNTDWFPRSLIRRSSQPYAPTKGYPVLTASARVTPQTPPLHLSLEEADSVPLTQRIDKPMRFSANGIDAIIDPARLMSDGAGGGVLLRADLLVLHLIARSYPERPVYFARSTAGYPEQLGLHEHLITHGLVRKLVTPRLTQRDGIAYIENDGWIDIARSQQLWNAYTAPDAIARKGFWADMPSANILAGYLLAGMALRAPPTGVTPELQRKVQAVATVLGVTLS